MAICKNKVKIKQFAKPAKETLPKKIAKSLPKKPISFKKPASKPIIKQVC